MKIAFYCQHVLGIGHFQRSLTLCQALINRGHTVSLILGGPEVEVKDPSISTFQLPGLKMDAEFGGLIPCAPGKDLDEVKDLRRSMLYSFFEEERPEVFITELYPMGRKAFRFELDPVLGAIKCGSLAPTLCCSSVRDILVEKKTGKEAFEARAVKTLNNYFHGLLIHADPQVIQIDETFDSADEIKIPYQYTGFIAPLQSEDESPQTPISTPDKPIVIASIGGGNVGGELLEAVVSAAQLADSSYHLKIFCGKYSDIKLYKDLKKFESENITVETFTDQFSTEIAQADLSISMAGYNTCMNILQAGIPALLFPFAQNREQRLRVEKLSQATSMTLLNESDLPPHRLNNLIKEQLAAPKFSSTIDLHGAHHSALQIEKWFKEFSRYA